MNDNNNFMRNAKVVEGLMRIYNNDREYYDHLISKLSFRLSAFGVVIRPERISDTILNETYRTHNTLLNAIKEVVSNECSTTNIEKINFFFDKDTLIYLGITLSDDVNTQVHSGGLNKIKLAVAEVIKSAVDSGNLNELNELTNFGNSFKGMEQLPKDRDYRNLELGDWILIIEGKFDFGKLPLFQGDRPVTLDSAVNQQTVQNNQQQQPVGIKVKK